MVSTSAYLLVFHGSRDPRPQQAVEQLSQLVLRGLQARQLVRGGDSVTRLEQAIGLPRNVTVYPSLRPVPILVGTACLELGPLPFPLQVEQFAREAIATGCTEIQVLPLFLLPGVHVKADIPAALAIAQSHLPAPFVLNLRPYLGSHPGLIHLLPGADADEAIILLSHGSRRPHGNQPVEQLANQLNALPAYWSVAPTLEVQVEQLASQGYGQVKIIPYFLFSGGITDAIARQVSQLAQQQPAVQFQLAKPFGPTPALADCVIDLVADSTPLSSTMAYDC